MTTFTLDTNCLIDVDEGREAAPHVLALAGAHARGEADVALVAVSASERQPGDTYLPRYEDFQGRVARLGLGHLPVLLGMAYFDMSYWDHALSTDEAMKDREMLIHSVLFPNIAFDWPTYALTIGGSPDSVAGPGARRWKNTFCDRQMYWAHDHEARQVFVTSDGNFRRLMSSPEFPQARVMSPRDAAQLLRSAGG